VPIAGENRHGRVRTVPMSVWVKVAIDAWTLQAGVTDGCVFRLVIEPTRCRAVQYDSLPW